MGIDGGAAVGTIFVAGKVVDGEGTGSGPSDFAFNAQNVLADFDTIIIDTTFNDFRE